MNEDEQHYRILTPKGNSGDRYDDIRKPFERDYGRVLHSATFRRLQSKTQVLGLGDSDFYRTRLTHSIEVAQIAEGITLRLMRRDFKNLPKDEKEKECIVPCSSLIRSISYLHDIGHPPFGHGGEIALNYMMLKYHKDQSCDKMLGFEGNAQTLRIVSKLEKQTENNGINLTRRSLLGILKYPSPYSKVNKTLFPETFSNNYRTIVADKWKPPKCYFDDEEDVVKKILEPFSESDQKKFKEFKEPVKKDKHWKTAHKSFDCSIMDLADEISYGAHDLEDAIKLSMVTKDDWEEAMVEPLKKIDNKWLKRFKVDELAGDLFSGLPPKRKGAIGGIVNAAISSIEVVKIEGFESSMLKLRVKMSDNAQTLISALTDLVRDNVIKSPKVQQMEYRGQQIVMELFECLESDPERLVASSTFAKIDGESKEKRLRIICDNISGMTDDYATRLYQRLLVPNYGSVFDQI